MCRKAVFGGTYEKIEEMALLVREKVSSRLDPKPSSVRDLLKRTVERFGGQIKIMEDPSDPLRGGGSLVINRPEDFTIWLSPYQSPLRANFTIAHELGHYLLHYKQTEEHDCGPVVFNRFGSDVYEWQANRFAAAFLMPTEKFREYSEKFEGNTVLLAGHFGVSEAAVEVRSVYVKKIST